MIRLSKNAVVSSFFILFCASTLVACNILKRYDKYDGVTYIAPVGKPPADSLIWSPIDPQKILVTAISPRYQGSQIYILNITTGEKQIIAETEYGALQATAWSRDENKIIFMAYPATSGYEDGGLWVWKASDNSVTYLSDGNYATWSPDGKLLLIVKQRLETMPAPNKIELHFFTDGAAHETAIHTIEDRGYLDQVSWASDGRHLVFSLASDIAVVGDIFILDIQTWQISQITQDGVNLNASWSPTGNLIVYGKWYQEPNRTIYSLHLITPDGMCDVEIPKIDSILSSAWSPDGQSLAAIGPDGIYIIMLKEIFGNDDYENLCP